MKLLIFGDYRADFKAMLRIHAQSYPQFFFASDPEDRQNFSANAVKNSSFPPVCGIL
ncbi:hypothetical protein LAN87_003998 [Salmonella enterica]|nr:hypothetical protein [Salmonella enterica]HCM1832021.1 hypothetical protein [Salmonella enterica subsp. salamae serovar 48:z81:z39]EHX3573676.1 hypothetical protein [Salmonella enterica]EIB6274632.1 hypothetical protein [Salmonella enterica]EIC8063124.1 hypothetical protein [Salmonella enterica]